MASNNAINAPTTTFSKTLIASGDAPTARTILGLGTAATHDVSDFAAPGSNIDITSLLGLTGAMNLNAVLASSLTASGFVTSFTVGESLTFGSPTYVEADGKMYKADSEFGGPLAVYLCLGTYSSSQTGEFLKFGFVRNDSWAWTVSSDDGLIYLSDTATLTQTAPSSSTDAVQILGYAVTSTIILFDPFNLLVTPLGNTLLQLTSASDGRTALGVPATDGTGATGTWGINISGNAATVTTNANLTGDVTSSGNTTTLDTLGSFAGTYGSNSAAPVITVNNKGQVTAASSATITVSAIGAAASGANSDITSLSGIRANIALNQAPLTGNTSGLVIPITAGENFSMGDSCYIKSSDGKAYKADATDNTKFPARYIASTAISSGVSGNFLRTGIASLNTWSWTTGAQLFLSTTGSMTQTAPSGSGNCIQVLGIALSATIVDFNATTNYLVHA